MEENVNSFELIDQFKDEMYVWILDPDSSPQSKRFEIMKTLQNNVHLFRQDSGVVNSYEIILQSPITSYVEGQVFYFISANENTISNPTLNIDGVGNRFILKNDGSALSPGDIPANSFNIVGYDGAGFRLLNLGGAGGGLPFPPNDIGFMHGIIGQSNEWRRIRYTQPLVGTIANLRTIPTTTGANGATLFYFEQGGNEVQPYQLVSGPAVDDPPNTVLPNDYDPLTNARSWRKGVFPGGGAVLQDGSGTTFNVDKVDLGGALTMPTVVTGVDFDVEFLLEKDQNENVVYRPTVREFGTNNRATMELQCSESGGSALLFVIGNAGTNGFFADDFVTIMQFGTINVSISGNDGLRGAADYSSNYNDLSFTQKGYVDKNQLRNFTVATAPVAANTGEQIFVTDEVGGSVPAFWDGADWRRVTDRAIIST